MLVHIVSMSSLCANRICRLPNGEVDSTSALQAEGLGFDPHQRHEPHKLIYLKNIIFLNFFLNCLKNLLISVLKELQYLNSNMTEYRNRNNLFQDPTAKYFMSLFSTC